MNSTRTLIRAVRGPILLIVLGGLFSIDYFGPYSFARTWPVLLIIYGALWLVERLVEDRDFGPGSPEGGSL